MINQTSKIRAGLALALVGAGFTAASFVPKVSHAQTQREMNAQAAKEYEAADATLNKVYKQVMSKLGKQSQTNLRTKQRAWIKYRDKEAQEVADENRGGTIAPMEYYLRLTELTELRIEELKKLTGGSASAAPYTPKPGSTERNAIMNAMRNVVGKGKKKKIRFLVEHLKVEKGWAYFAGGFEYADGTEVGADYMWGNLSALLHMEKNAWVLKRYVHNTDIIEPEFIEEFPQAPKAIFKRTPPKR